MEISGFRVPEYNDQGQMTSQLFGDHAELQGNREVEITGARMEFYRDGDVFMTVQSPRCFYNQKSRKVQSEEAVTAEMDGVRLTGTGYFLDVDGRTVRVLNDSRVVFAEAFQSSVFEGMTGGAKSTNETVITSKQLFLDYTARSARFSDSVYLQDEEMSMECGQLDVFFNESSEIERAVAESDVKLSNEEWKVLASRGTLLYLERTACLEGDVQVESKELSMTCATLNLSFDESNKINWIEALTDVRISREGREAYAGHAVYDIKTDEFLLEDKPKLVDGRNMMFGDTIRFWRATGRMICEPSARVVVYPDKKFKTEIFEN